MFLSGPSAAIAASTVQLPVAAIAGTTIGIAVVIVLAVCLVYRHRMLVLRAANTTPAALAILPGTLEETLPVSLTVDLIYTDSNLK